jgi:hypothetical protein
MITFIIYALSSDPHWLKAMEGAADTTYGVRSQLCAGDYVSCVNGLPPPAPTSVLVLDATGHPLVEQVLGQARHLGWQHVVVVAADPSWQQARLVLRTAQGRRWDYWNKSMNSEVIRSALRHLLGENLAPDSQESG